MICPEILDLRQVVLSQEDKETERKALGGARSECAKDFEKVYWNTYCSYIIAKDKKRMYVLRGLEQWRESNFLK